MVRPGKELCLQESLKLGGIWILKTAQLVQALLNELNPAEAVGANSAQSDGLSTHNQPLLSTSHGCVK